MQWLFLFSNIFIFGNSPTASPLSHLPVPIIRQATHYSCGAASLLAVLYYWKVYDGTESSLHKILNTTEAEGTEPTLIAKAARKFGLKAYMKEHLKLSDLRSALHRGNTVILDLQAWRDKIKRHFRLGIFIRGKKPIQRFPAPFIRME